MSENGKKDEHEKDNILEKLKDDKKVYIKVTGDTKKRISERWAELNTSYGKTLSHNEFLEALLVTNIQPKTLVRNSLDKTRKEIYIFSNMDPKLDDLIGYLFAIIQQCYLRDMKSDIVLDEIRKTIKKMKE